MAAVNLNAFLRQLTRGRVAETVGDQSDQQLVERFLTGADQTVFEALVRRHGLMVYRVCWRVLQQDQDTEDAFQATFLLLAQNLRTIRQRASLASWLHGVARRVALKAQAQAAARRRYERQASVSQASSHDDLTWRELRSVLDAELAQLPEKWRLPLILCYLEGRTQDEAAGQLGWGKNTLRRRLDEARAALGRRLARRGFWPAALSAALLSDCIGSAAPPASLIASTIEVAAYTAAGRTTATVFSARVVALTEGVLRTMFLSKLQVVTALLLLGILGVGLGATRLIDLTQAAEKVDAQTGQGKDVEQIRGDAAGEGGIKKEQEREKPATLPADAPAASERDPQEVFRRACERLVALEGKHDLLQGVSKVKPTVEKEAKERLKSAHFVFENNAEPPGKGPAKPKDDTKPYFYVSVQVWSGRSQQPPAGLRAFEWKGEPYQAWVQVYGSDADLVKTVREAIDGPELQGIESPPNRDATSPIDLVKAAITRVGFPPEGHPVLPSLSTEMRGHVCNEIAASAAVRSAYAKLDVARHRNVVWFEGVAELEKERAMWSLLSCLCHPSEDVQIHALRSLERLRDKRAVPFLLLYAEYMAVFEQGSENATIHGVIHQSVAKTLSTLTGVEVVLKGQNPEGLKKGIKRWRKWLVLQDE